MHNKKIILLILVILLLLVCIKVIPSLSENNNKTEKYGFLMDTQVRIVIYDKGNFDNEAQKCYELISGIDKIMNTYNEDSELAKLNKTGHSSVSDYLYVVIKKSVEISEKTDGAFDVTIKPLSELWNFKNAKVPSESEILQAKSVVSYRNIELKENNIVALNNGVGVDLGGIAKGYAADKAVEFLKKSGIKNALVDIGGNIKFTGNSDKRSEGFLVGIQDPGEKNGISLGAIRLKDKTLVTGGIYERNFTSDGKLYNHILNPYTGYPVENELLSVTVISENSSEADAYATALMILGEEKGLKLLNSTNGIECIMVKKNNEIVLSEGIKKEQFEIRNDKYFIKE